MAEETLRMSAKERRRLVVMEQVKSGGLKLVEAADRMGLSYRQTKRIWARFRRRGEAGLIHAGRDQISNRRIDPVFHERIVALYGERYRDFGPTLASEKMAQHEGIVVHRETLRRWLIRAHLWSGRRAWRKHRRRRRPRAHFGELVQLDGSDHAWFEDRAPRACLMVMVDDATGRTEALMAGAETGAAAFQMLRKWIERHGVPAALYTDRKNIYVTDREPTAREKRLGTGALTDFGRACHRLGIEIIAANSAQAKGRVERKNGVFQDRLVKELRLEGIDTIWGANAILDGFCEDLNARFSHLPLEESNWHHAMPPGVDLADVLCFEKTRSVQNDWTFSLSGRVFQIPVQPQAPPARSRVTVRQRLDGRLICLYQGRVVKIEEVA
jgi:transposase